MLCFIDKKKIFWHLTYFISIFSVFRIILKRYKIFFKSSLFNCHKYCFLLICTLGSNLESKVKGCIIDEIRDFYQCYCLLELAKKDLVPTNFTILFFSINVEFKALNKNRKKGAKYKGSKTKVIVYRRKCKQYRKAAKRERKANIVTKYKFTNN